VLTLASQDLICFSAFMLFILFAHEISDVGGLFLDDPFELL
jgi:hypothetical protein